jgi:iron(III) transport system permease protein
MARPAIAAGTALALMETLADYGVGAYFGLTTFSTGIYKAWLVMNDRIAAAQLASVLLLVVALLLLAERAAQRGCALPAAAAAAGRRGPAAPLRGGAALAAWRCARCRCCWASCCRWPGWAHAVAGGATRPSSACRWERFAAGPGPASSWPAGRRWRPRRWRWRWPSCCAAAAGRLLQRRARVLSLGYAVPGAVIAVGILLPVGWLQQRWPEAGVARRWSPARCSACSTPTWCASRPWRCSRWRPATRACRVGGRNRAHAGQPAPGASSGGCTCRCCKRSALAAALLVFVDVMKELPATLVLRPFGSDTLAVVAYNFARDERLAEAALPSLAIVAVGLLPVILLGASGRNRTCI